MVIIINVHLVINQASTMECLMPPTISVVIPFYNAEPFFSEVYKSICSQTSQPEEIIVVIDGYSEKAETFLKEYKNIKVVTPAENCGPAKARNIGVSNATSELIAFIDADDKWEANKLEKQLEFLAKYPEFSACHTGIKTFSDNEIIATFNDKSFSLTLSEVLTACHVLPSSLMIKKSAFDTINGFDAKIRCSEDQEFTIRLISNDLKIGFLAEALSYLRREDQGNISSNGRNMVIGHFQILKKHWSLFRKNKGTMPNYLYKTFMTAGGKSKGIEKKSLYALGKVMSLIYPKLN
jgi:teichuronic acid biosynthesis glycosyltransferase TuaG